MTDTQQAEQTPSNEQAPKSWLDNMLDEERAEPVEAEKEQAADSEPEEAEQIEGQEQDQIEEEEKPAIAAKEEQKEDNHRIPLAELLKERDKRKQAETQANMLMRTLDELKEQIKELRTPKEEIPNFENDPAGYLQAQNKKLQEQINAINKQSVEQQTRADQEKKKQLVSHHINNYEAEFEASHPDYRKALEYLRVPAYNQLIDAGASHDEALNNIYAREFNESVNLMAYGYNPVEQVYNKALKLGYKPQAHEKQKEKEDDTAREKMENLDKALTAATGSGNRGGKVNIKEMLTSPDEIFNDMWEKSFNGFRRY